MRYTFKDRYTNAEGLNLEDYFATTFYSPAYTGGNGTRISPYRSTNLAGLNSTADSGLVLSGGVHKITDNLSIGATSNKYIVGSGIRTTIIEGPVKFTPKANLAPSVLFKDLYLLNVDLTILSPLNNFTIKYAMDRIVLDNVNLYVYGSTNKCTVSIARCLIRNIIPTSNFATTFTYNNNLSFVNISTTIGSTGGNLHTFEKCNLIVNQASLDSYKNNYYAFDNCSFRIGTETDYTPLTGTTADELRASFVARCTAAGLTVPADITDYGITLTLGRWVFTKDQIFEGVTWKGSEINLFEVPRLISFGYSDTIDKIGITTAGNVPGTFSPAFPNTGSPDFQTGGVYLPDTDDITDLHSYSMASNFISFGAKKQLTRLMLVDNLPAEYGVKADSTQDLLSGSPIAPGGAISPGVYYIVRSSDKQPATISYNGATYSTSLNTRNNLVPGVAAASTFTAASGNPVLYPVNDELQYKTLQVRVMNKIPADIIKTGALLAGYWYIVEHDSDQSNATDYVTYNGVNYYTGSSFLVATGITGFTVTGSTHLRRICKDVFDWDTEAVDKDFWEFTQKPEWVDVIDGDPRCLLHNNHDLAHEMQRDASGNYIASGHPDFYKIITGEAGIPMKPQPVKGAYMQIRLVISTLNIM